MNEKFCYSAISSHKLLSKGLTLSESVPYGQNSKELCDLLGSIRVVDCESQTNQFTESVHHQLHAQLNFHTKAISN